MHWVIQGYKDALHVERKNILPEESKGPRVVNDAAKNLATRIEMHLIGAKHEYEIFNNQTKAKELGQVSSKFAAAKSGQVSSKFAAVKWSS